MSDGGRWLAFLASAAALHAAALFGVGLPAREPSPVVLDSAPVELSFESGPVVAAAVTPPPPALRGLPPPPGPQPEPEWKATPEPKPEPEPEPEPAPRPVPAPETPPEARAGPVQPVSTPPEPPAATPAAKTAIAQPLTTRFRGKPARNARGYFGQISAWIDANKAYPVECRKDKEQGAVVVRFTIARDGRLLGATVKAGSGHARLDRAALETLERAAPFPPIPDFVGRDTLSIAVPIEYSLVTE